MKKIGLIWKFILFNLKFSIIAGLIAWMVFDNVFVKNLESNLKRDMYDKLNIISRLVDSYKSRIKEMKRFQKHVIKNMLYNTADDFYIAVQDYYERTKQRRISVREAKAKAWELLNQKRIGKSGYIYILNKKGTVLYHPKRELRGVNVNLPKKQYNFIRFQMQNSSRDKEKAFIEYKWQNPGESTWRPKVLAQIYFQPWDWIISVSSYKVEFDFIVDAHLEKHMFEKFRKEILSIQFGRKGYPVIIMKKRTPVKDEEGKVLEYREKGEIVIHKDSNVEGRQIANVHEMINRKINQESSGFLKYRYQKAEKYLAFQSDDELNWILAVSVYADEYFSGYQTYLRKSVTYLIVGFLFMNLLWAGLFFYFLVVRVIKKVRIKLNAVAGGDLSIKRPLAKGKDNIGLMLKAITNMMGKLEYIVVNILSVSREISKSITEVFRGNTELSDRTEQQAVALEQVSSTIEEFSITVKSNTENTQRASNLSQKAKSQTQQGGEVMYRAVEVMHEVQASSLEIENIMNIIEEIAFQTNLLALNASVEAARAGEHGRGFAVVALEIRNLAKNTSTFAKKSNELIQGTVDKIEQGNELVTEAGDALQEIITTISSAATLIEEVSSASEEQQKGMQEINRAVLQLQEINDQNSQLAQEISANSHQVVAEMKMLNDLIAYFKLNPEVMKVYEGYEKHLGNLRAQRTPLLDELLLENNEQKSEASKDKSEKQENGQVNEEDLIHFENHNTDTVIDTIHNMEVKEEDGFEEF